jgi:hypothetical protein
VRLEVFVIRTATSETTHEDNCNALLFDSKLSRVASIIQASPNTQHFSKSDPLDYWQSVMNFESISASFARKVSPEITATEIFGFEQNNDLGSNYS